MQKIKEIKKFLFKNTSKIFSQEHFQLTAIKPVK